MAITQTAPAAAAGAELAPLAAAAPAGNAAQAVPYGALRDGMRTGDLVLFSGRTWFSRAVQYFSDTPWSHVGMVVRLPEYDFVCLYEATALHDLQDLDTGTVHDGVQLVPLSRRVETYNGGVVYRKLHGFDVSGEHLQKLLKLRQTFRGRPWEKHNMELVRAMWASITGPSAHGRVDLSSFFCSELISKCYQTLGLLESGPHARPCDEYIPADFSAQRGTALLQGAQLGPEVLLKPL